MAFTLGLLLTLVLAVFIIATSSIGIQCIRDKKSTEMPTNEKFLIFNLVAAIIVVLISGFMMTTHPHAQALYNAGGKAYSSVASLGSST